MNRNCATKNCWTTGCLKMNRWRKKRTIDCSKTNRSTTKNRWTKSCSITSWPRTSHCSMMDRRRKMMRIYRWTNCWRKATGRLTTRRNPTTKSQLT
jgi:hypothetical protein